LFEIGVVETIAMAVKVYFVDWSKHGIWTKIESWTLFQLISHKLSISDQFEHTATKSGISRACIFVALFQ